MNVASESRHYQFTNKNVTVYIDFAFEFYPSPHEYKDRCVTYCTTSVYYHSGENYCGKDMAGAVKHYHGGTVYHPNDNYNQRTGCFIAFRNALWNRWTDEGWLINEGITWDEYHTFWAHFLAAMMDGKVDKDGTEYNPGAL